MKLVKQVKIQEIDLERVAALTSDADTAEQTNDLALAFRAQADVFKRKEENEVLTMWIGGRSVLEAAHLLKRSPARPHRNRLLGCAIEVQPRIHAKSGPVIKKSAAGT